MDFQTKTFHQYFTESWKIFTGNTTITNILTDKNISSVFYRELQNIYCKCHNHRRLCRRIQSVGISPRVEKYLLHMLQSPTDYFCRYISNENFFFGVHVPSIKSLAFHFFTDRIRDIMWNYWRKLCRRTDSVGDLVGKIITDEMLISHRRIQFVGKTVKCYSVLIIKTNIYSM
jgi:hypothetical protein